MASALTLDDIRGAAEKKYAAREIDLGGEVVSLRNPLRMTKDERKALQELNLEDFEEAVDYFHASFSLVSSEKEADALREAIGDDAAVYATLFEVYVKDVDLGEVSPSQD